MTGSRAASSLFIIGGTTASGKSAAALALAARIEGVIVNADSVQLYRDLPTLTARPGARDEAAIPHRLYGILDAATPASAALWLERAQAVIGEVGRSGRPPILVGGTGLYLQALLRGLVALCQGSGESYEGMFRELLELLKQEAGPQDWLSFQPASRRHRG